MPTYQYRCTACGHDLEAVQKFSDSALTECPNCGGQLRKIFNAVGVVFKGSGFYRTDSREKVSENGTNGKSSTKSESGSKESAGQESGGKGSGGQESGGKGSGGKESGGSTPPKADSGSGSGAAGSSSSGKQSVGSGSSSTGAKSSST